MSRLKSSLRKIFVGDDLHGPAKLYRGTVVALIPILAIAILCAGFFKAPESGQRSLQDWANAAPTDFVLTAAFELANQKGKGSNGPPYNLLDRGQSLGPIDPQAHTDLGIPIDPGNDFVISPLQVSQTQGVYAAIGKFRGLSTDAQIRLIEGFVKGQGKAIGGALGKWTSATSSQQAAWTTSYINALGGKNNRETLEDDPSYGPVKTLTDALLFLAQAGTLDGLLTTQQGPYPSDFTKPALFLGDGKWIAEEAQSAFLDGHRMAVASGTNSFPGQFWLTPYAFWYSVKPFSTSRNADIEVFAILLIICLLTMYLPKIPGLPKLVRFLPFQNLRGKT